MESFISASSLGASYVEFDVQLTKDHVPVIYHDFLVAESGVDIPMHELTLEQFLNLSETHKSDKKHKDDFELNGRYYSTEESRKMGLTKTYKTLNFKGNSRGSSIASSFLTLEEVFKSCHQMLVSISNVSILCLMKPPRKKWDRLWLK